jgi:mRNA interferase MazF
MNYSYVPERQDIIWINFLPTVGEELRGRHPAVVLSTKIYSELTGLVLVTPITHGANDRLKDFFIPLNSSAGGKTEGFINPLQLFTFSVKGRKAEFTGEILTDSTFALVQKKVRQLVG